MLKSLGFVSGERSRMKGEQPGADAASSSDFVAGERAMSTDDLEQIKGLLATSERDREVLIAAQVKHQAEMAAWLQSLEEVSALFEESKKQQESLEKQLRAKEEEMLETESQLEAQTKARSESDRKLEEKARQADELKVSLQTECAKSAAHTQNMTLVEEERKRAFDLINTEMRNILEELSNVERDANTMIQMKRSAEKSAMAYHTKICQMEGDFRASMQSADEAQKKRQERALKEMEEQCQTQMAQVSADHEQKVAALQKEIQDAVKVAAAEAKESAERHQRQMDDMEQQHQTQMAQVSADHEQKVAALQKEIQDAAKVAAAEAKESAERHQRQMDEMEEQCRIQMAQVSADHEQRVAALQKEIQDASKEARDMEFACKKSLTKMQAQMQECNEGWLRKYDDLSFKHAESIVEIDAGCLAKVKEAHIMAEKRESELQADLLALRRDMAELELAVKAREEECERALSQGKETTASFTTQLIDLQEQLDEKSNTLDLVYITLSQAEERNQALHQELLETKQSLQTANSLQDHSSQKQIELDQQLSDMEQACQEKLLDMANELTELNAGYEKKILEEQTQTKIALEDSVHKANQVLELTASVKTLNSDLINMQDSAQKARDKVEELERELAACKKHLMKGENQDQGAHRSTESSEKLQKALDACRHALAQAEGKVERQSHLLKTEKQARGQLYESWRQRDSDCKILENELLVCKHELEQALHSAKTMTEPEADLLSASRESLLATIKDLKQKLLSAEKSEEEYKTLLDDASRKLMESANMIVQVRDEAREAMQVELVRWAAEVDTFKKTLAESRNSQSCLEIELKTVSSELQECREKLSEAQLCRDGAQTLIDNAELIAGKYGWNAQVQRQETFM